MTISTARTAVKTALSSVTALRVFDYLKDAPPPTAAIVGWPEDFDPRETLNVRNWTYRIPVYIIIPRGDDRAADDAMEALLAPTGTSTSIFAALDAATNLSGAVDSMTVVNIAQARPGDVNGVTVLSCEVTVEVMG